MYAKIYNKITKSKSPGRNAGSMAEDPFSIYKKEYIAFVDKNDPVYQKELRRKNRDILERFAKSAAERE